MNLCHNALLDLRSSSPESNKDPKAGYCPTVVINNETRQTLYE